MVYCFSELCTTGNKAFHLLEVDNNPSGAGVKATHGLPRSDGGDDSTSNSNLRNEGIDRRYI